MSQQSTARNDARPDEEEQSIAIEALTEEIHLELSATGPVSGALDAIAATSYRVHVAKGFHDEDRTVAHAMGLVTTELAEVIEHDRNGTSDAPSAKIPEFTNMEEEVADAILRLLDFAGKHHLRVGAAVVAKTLYNARRPRKHGKKY